MTYVTMWTRLFFLPILLFVTLGSIGCQQEESSDGEDDQPGRTLEYTRQVTFLNSNNESITTIEVAVADNNAERSTGLMDVTQLPANNGMLFIFDDEIQRSFWMANTPLSLDMIFVNSDMEIVRIYHNTQPFTEDNFMSGEPAQYVVETNGGFCVSNDIQEGMRISISDI